jgi:hypothetical protein
VPRIEEIPDYKGLQGIQGVKGMTGTQEVYKAMMEIQKVLQEGENTRSHLGNAGP